MMRRIRETDNLKEIILEAKVKNEQITTTQKNNI